LTSAPREPLTSMPGAARLVLSIAPPPRPARFSLQRTGFSRPARAPVPAVQASSFHVFLTLVDAAHPFFENFSINRCAPDSRISQPSCAPRAPEQKNTFPRKCLQPISHPPGLCAPSNCDLRYGGWGHFKTPAVCQESADLGLFWLSPRGPPGCVECDELWSPPVL